MALETFFQLCIVCLIGAMSPGPSMVVVLNNAIFKSKFHGFMTSIGHGIGITFYALSAVIGLGYLMDKNFFWFEILQFFSIALLIYIGVDSLKSKKKLQFSEKTEHSKNVSFFQGLAISLFNPKILVWFVAIYSQFMYSNANIYYNSILVITAGIIDASWYLLLTLIITSSLSLSLIEKKFFFIKRIMGITLIILGLILFIRLI